MRKKLGLSGKLVLMILFSALASAVFLVGMQVVLNKALWLYFDQPETQQKAVEKQVQELQSYIDRRGLSSRDIDKLDDWSVRNGSTMFIIYDRSRMLYSSYPLVAPVYEGRENVTEAVPAERWLPMYSLTFSDKETTAMFYYNGVDAYYGKGCEILLLVSFALFPLFFFLSSRKIIRYILLLSGEIQAMEGGDLDHPITIQGDDELALLATSLDGLRLTLRQQQAEEAQAAAKVKSLITEMSHDLRTPLTTLLLYTEILRHHKYETEAQAGRISEQRSTARPGRSSSCPTICSSTRWSPGTPWCSWMPRPASPRSLKSRWPRWWRCCSSAALPVRWSWAARMCS